MTFFSRRQSQDRALRERLLSLAENQKLWMNEYSAKQFGEADGITVDNDYLAKAGQDDYCFVENGIYDLSVACEVVLCRWNRRYPANKFFDADLESLGFKLEYSEDIKGYSHDKITVEIYRR